MTGNGLDHFGDVRRRARVHFDQTQAEEQDVAVGVVEAGDDGAAFEIGHLRPRPNQWIEIIVRTDGDDFAVADGEGLRGGLRRVKGDNVAVSEDGVSVKHGSDLRLRGFGDKPREQFHEEIFELCV
jgi:hypothetical protein